VWGKVSFSVGGGHLGSRGKDVGGEKPDLCAIQQKKKGKCQKEER